MSLLSIMINSKQELHGVLIAPSRRIVSIFTILLSPYVIILEIALNSEHIPFTVPVSILIPR